MGDISAEPSMEEILSSIKRIMAEEGDGPVRSRRPVRPVAATASSLSYDEEGDSILELDDPIEPPVVTPAVTVPRIIAEPVVPPRVEPVAEQVDEPAPPPPAAPRPAAAEPDADEGEPIVSDRAAAASRQSIEHLTRTLNAAAPAAAPTAPAGFQTADASLEGMVREMLRPMLRDWLDSRLPAIVEQQVAAEIARITGAR